jgi:DNA invertase Pin-like site-specific DNA recombinase
MTTVYGYGRVSTNEQDLGAQIDELKAAGCAKVFAEKISAEFAYNRPQLQKLLKKLGPGDVLVITL